jgi:hypothetical protein
MSATQTTMDHHLGALNTAFTGLQVANTETSTSTAARPITPPYGPQHSRNSSRASTVSSIITPTNDNPRSRNNTQLSRASSRGRLPDAADPEYSYVYVPTQHNPNNPNMERSSMRSEESGRSSRSAFLDVATVPGRPRSTNAMTENQPSKLTDRRQRDRTRSEEWADRGAALIVRDSSSRNGDRTTTTARVIKKGVKDFQFGRTLGEGSYSTVVAATDRSTLKEYAIKMLDKRHIIKERKVKYVSIEKVALNRLGDHPGIVKLYFTFQDETTLYFALDLAANGELLGFIKKVRLRVRG